MLLPDQQERIKGERILKGVLCPGEEQGEETWEGGNLHVTNRWNRGFHLPGLSVRRLGDEVVPLTASAPVA